MKLDQSVKTAEKILCAAVEEKNKRPFYYNLLKWLLLVSIGFGIGSLISHRNTPVFPQEFSDIIDRLEYKVEEAFHKRNILDKQRERS